MIAMIILLLFCDPLLFPQRTDAGEGITLLPPKNLTYRVHDDLITISWEGVAGALGYKVHIGDGPNGYSEGALDVGPLTELGPVDIHVLPKGKAYYLTVSAYDEKRESETSDEIAVKLPYFNPGDFDLTRIMDLLLDDVSGRYGGMSLGRTLRITSLINPDLYFAYAAFSRPGLYHRIPGGIAIDYDDGFLGKDGHHHAGKVLFSLSNFSSRLGNTRAGFSVVADTVYIDGTYLADGSAFGSISIKQRVGGVEADISLQGIFYSQSGPIFVEGRAFFNTTACKDYPISGYVKAFHKSGTEEVLTFPGSCEGSYIQKINSVVQ